MPFRSLALLENLAEHAKVCFNSEKGKLPLLQSSKAEKAFSFRGLCPMTRGSASGPAGVNTPDPAIGSRYHTRHNPACCRIAFHGFLVV